MKLQLDFTLFAILLLVIPAGADDHYYQTDFTKEEFIARRAKIFEKIGKKEEYSLDVEEKLLL